MKTLHSKILDVRPVKKGPHAPLYCLGHTDARHAAAVLAVPYDNLVASAQRALDAMKYYRATANIKETRELAEALRALDL